jgi:hypothetical protein
MPHGLFGPITEDDKWGAKKWVAYAFFSVVKGCCPGEDVRSHYVRVYVSRSAFASYLIATINVKCLVGTRNPRAMSPTLQMLAARHEDTEQDRSRGRSDRVYQRV